MHISFIVMDKTIIICQWGTETIFNDCAYMLLSLSSTERLRWHSERGERKEWPCTSVWHSNLNINPWGITTQEVKKPDFSRKAKTEAISKGRSCEEWIEPASWRATASETRVQRPGRLSCFLARGAPMKGCKEAARNGQKTFDSTNVLGLRWTVCAVLRKREKKKKYGGRHEGVEIFTEPW